MRTFLTACALSILLTSGVASAEDLPKLEVAPVVGAQFFRGAGDAGWGRDQTLQNGAILGARGGALFADRLRIELGIEYTPTVVVGADRFTHVLQPHLDLSLDLTNGWIRPYVGLGVGSIAFFDGEWSAGSLGELGGQANTGRRPDVEFTGALMLGSRFFLGDMVDMLDGTVVRVDVRDVIYAPRNIEVNYLATNPGALEAFHNVQFTLSLAWVFDAFAGEVEHEAPPREFI